jgi:LPXTG-motif cell wall-anchored protein
MLKPRNVWRRQMAMKTAAVAIAAALLSAPGVVWASENAEDSDAPTSIETPTPVVPTSAPSNSVIAPESGGRIEEPATPDTAATSPAEAPSQAPGATGNASALAPAAAIPTRDPLPLDNLPLRDLGSGVPDSIRNNFGSAVENQFIVGRPIEGGASAGTVPAGLEEFYSQVIEWQSCASFGENGYAADPRFSCGYAIVPLDYAEPAGTTIAVSMLRVHTTGTEKKGTLFMDPGGPGGSGMDVAASRANQYASIGLLDDFDLIGIDPRGVGSSAPTISCFSGGAFDAYRESSDLETARNSFMADGCKNNTALEYPDIDAGAFLRSVGTNNVVKDLDVARSIVGDPRLNYLGYSYGTSIGYNYALEFPEGVRAMVLDAIVNPFENNPAELAKYDEFFKNGGASQSASMAEAMKQFVAKCEAQDGFEFNGELVPCAAAAEPPAEPVWSESQQRYLGVQIDFSMAWAAAMYSETSWPKLNAGLSALMNGEDPAELLALADGYFSRSEDGEYGPGEGAFLQIGMCADDASVGCGAQATEPMRKGEPIAALTNVLSISGTYDNATAYPNGVVMAQAIGGTLLSVATNSHGSVANRIPVTCVDVIAATYLRTLEIAENTGKRGVATKDIYSNPITGDQCQIDQQWRAVPTAPDQAIEAGQTLEVSASGLTRGGKYTVSVVAPDGSLLFGTAAPVVAAADGTLVVALTVKQSADSGDYRILVEGAEEITRVLADAVGTLRVSAVIIPTPTDAAIRLSAASTSAAGASQSVLGAGFAPESDVTIHLDDVSSAPLGRIKAGADGSFVASVVLPDLSVGRHSIIVAGEDGVLREAGFDVVTLAPAVTMSARNVRVGDEVTVSLTGFAPNSEAIIELHSTPQYLGTVRLDAAGSGSLTVKIPAAEIGDHRIVATGGSGIRAEQSIVLLPGGQATGAALAATGQDGARWLPWAGVSMLLLIMGTLLVTARRLRRT